MAFLVGDWNGTPYEVTNSCGNPISVDNGHDGLFLEADETVTIAGFSDLVLRIGPPGGLKGAKQHTFKSSPVDLVDALCPQ